MRQSRLLSKTRKEAPAGEEAKNAKLLIQSGFVHKEMAGVYSYLPLGWQVLNNIMKIIREEMNAIGGQELQLSALQDPAPWQASGRWSDDEIDVWFKTTLANGTEVGLGNTHEEALARLMTHHVNSHHDLPLYPYQFQTKFRNELRAKSGIMRGREFIMKDLYSLSPDEESFRSFYEQCAEAYQRIFDRCGVGERTFRTFASGGSFSKYSDEFQTLTDAGEDTIHLDRAKGIAINDEVYGEEAIKDTGVTEKNLEKAKSIEVGNIFPLGTKYSEALGLVYKDADGNEKPVVMGSYGIGPGRLMGAIVELFGTDTAMLWPKSVAPAQVHLIALGSDEETHAQAERVYETLGDAGIDVLFDDRPVSSAGAKFADADLIGIPTRMIVGTQAREQGGVEVTDRLTDTTRIVEEGQLKEAI